MIDQLTDNDLIKKICAFRAVRVFLAKRSFKWFFTLYFSEYIKKETAPFHDEIMKLVENDNNEFTGIMAFRGSGKSSIVTCAGALWHVLNGRKKFVVIFSRTQDLAKIHFQNIKGHLEGNNLIINDFGPFKGGENEWSAYSVELPHYKAKIMAASSEQSARGLRFYENRPQLILLDDIEDNASTKTLESREKTYDWFTREVIPLRQDDTRIILVGTPVHNDSLIMRVKNSIAENKMSGVFKSYPIMDENKNIAWPAMYPDMAAIERLRLIIGDEKAFQQEYMLKIISDDKPIINLRDIKRYNKIDESKEQQKYILVGIDPAISETNYADFSAIVVADIYISSEGVIKIYILPNMVNAKMDFPHQVDTLKNFYQVYSKNAFTRVIVESVSYQKALCHVLIRENIAAEEYKVIGDKRSRLNVLHMPIQKGNILFPETGAENLIGQITNFGNCKNDDLVDAFSMICNLAMEESDIQLPDVFII